MRQFWVSGEASRLEAERLEYEEFAREMKTKCEQLNWWCGKCGGHNGGFEKKCEGCGIERGHKVILFVRHGEGVHNLSIWKAMRNRDALLTSKGVDQCRLMRESIGNVPADVVISSPLSRTIQTAYHVFGGHENDELRPQRRFSLCPLHTEYYEKMALCNQGSEPHLLLKQFPFLGTWENFDALPERWWPTAESDRNWHIERTGRFRQYLASLEEQNIVIVGHGAFTKHLLNLEHAPRNCGVVFARMTAEGEIEIVP